MCLRLPTPSRFCCPPPLSPGSGFIKFKVGIKLPVRVHPSLPDLIAFEFAISENRPINCYNEPSHGYTRTLFRAWRDGRPENLKRNWW